VDARRSNGFRESKFWVPVYVWTTRKRADQAYKAYLINVDEKLAEIDAGLEQASLELATGHARAKAKAEASSTMLKAERKIVTKSIVSHFDFLEAVAGYHIIKVRCRPVRLAALTALATLTALNPSRHGWVWKIAHSLVASSFYRRLVT
jgi:hypothetical protein